MYSFKSVVKALGWDFNSILEELCCVLWRLKNGVQSLKKKTKGLMIIQLCAAVVTCSLFTYLVNANKLYLKQNVYFGKINKCICILQQYNIILYYFPHFIPTNSRMNDRKCIMRKVVVIVFFSDSHTQTHAHNTQPNLCACMIIEKESERITTPNACVNARIYIYI